VSRASHAAAFAAGAVIAAAIGAAAVPAPRRDVARFQALDAFAQALATIQASYVEPADEQRLLHDAARGMLHNLDPYSTFLPPTRYQRLRQDTEGEFGGTGVTLAPGVVDDARPTVPPHPTIDAIAPRSPAEVAGLQLDDRVVAIDGAPTAEPGRELAAAGAWEQKLRGPSGTRVVVSVLRAGWKAPRPVTLVRAQVKQATVEHRAIERGIGYLAIARFSEATSADTAAALAALRAQRALSALVLDLRSDPGGLVDQAIAVADQFLDEGTIVTIGGRRGAVETQVAHRGGPGVGVPLVVLIDHGTASAAEILAAALRDQGRAKLVGSPTFGKGTVQTFFDLVDGSGLKLTTARFYTPKGNSLESKGLVPDLAVEAFAPLELVAGARPAPQGDAAPTASAPRAAGTTSGAGVVAGALPRSAEPGNGATIVALEAEDPQLAAAVRLARQAARRTPRSE
jgi:carboxyl-terminal processing protease